MRDEDIDLTDIPEITDEQWATRRPGRFRPVKQPVTIRLDSDVVDWFKDRAGDTPYQTEINRVLREYVMRTTRLRAIRAQVGRASTEPRPEKRAKPQKKRA